MFSSSRLAEVPCLRFQVSTWVNSRVSILGLFRAQRVKDAGKVQVVFCTTANGSLPVL